MSFTLSHPAAVLPLFPWAREPIFMAALVIGSLSPDFGYYTRMFGMATTAHSLPGSIFICVPSGLVVLGAIILSRRPLMYLLPSRLGGPVSEVLTIPKRNRAGLVVQICFWLWLGACTHVVWDAFTHKTGWLVERSTFLQESLLSIGGTAVPTYYVLQQLSTVFGLAVAGIFVFLRLRRSAPLPHRRREDIRRYAFWCVLVMFSILGALPVAWQFAAQYEGFLRVRSLIFQTGVMSGSVCVILLMISLLVAAWILKRNTGSG